MPISKLILSYALTAVVFFAIDLLWLGIAARGTYQKYLGHLLAEQVNWTAAIIFYLLFIVGIFIFAIMPAVEFVWMTERSATARSRKGPVDL
jgi:uncharacterized membrane protein